MIINRLSNCRVTEQKCDIFRWYCLLALSRDKAHCARFLCTQNSFTLNCFVTNFTGLNITDSAMFANAV